MHVCGSTVWWTRPTWSSPWNRLCGTIAACILRVIPRLTQEWLRQMSSFSLEIFCTETKADCYKWANQSEDKIHVSSGCCHGIQLHACMYSAKHCTTVNHMYSVVNPHMHTRTHTHTHTHTHAHTLAHAHTHSSLFNYCSLGVFPLKLSPSFDWVCTSTQVQCKAISRNVHEINP